MKFKKTWVPLFSSRIGPAPASIGRSVRRGVLLFTALQALHPVVEKRLLLHYLMVTAGSFNGVAYVEGKQSFI